MRLERVGDNQIEVFFSFDELAERGLTKEDIEQNSLKWHQVCFEMINEIYNEFDFVFSGTLIIDIYSMQTNGMMFSFLIDDEEALFIDDDYLKDENQSENELFYSFADFEHVLQFAKRIQTNFDGGKLYYYNQLYYVLFPSGEIKDKKRLTSIVSEYGERSLDSPSMIQEYGKIIFEQDAVRNLNKFFDL